MGVDGVRGSQGPKGQQGDRGETGPKGVQTAMEVYGGPGDSGVCGNQDTFWGITDDSVVSVPQVSIVGPIFKDWIQLAFLCPKENTVTWITKAHLPNCLIW